MFLVDRGVYSHIPALLFYCKDERFESFNATNTAVVRRIFLINT